MTLEQHKLSTTNSHSLLDLGLSSRVSPKSKSFYFESFTKKKNGKHRIYSIFDSPKRCWE